MTGYLAREGERFDLRRLIGQHTLSEPGLSVRHKAKCRRIKTVPQDLIGKAARMISHAGQRVLGMGRSDRAFEVFAQHDTKLRST